MKASLIVAVLAALLIPSAETFSPDADGFIRNWLVLAPIAIQEDSGASEIDKDFLKGEATIKPKAGDSVTVDGKTLTWKPHQTSDFFIDFLQAFGKERGEDVAAYAVAYVIADDEMKVKLSIGSNDQSKAWLNGKPIIKFADTRTLEKDTDSGDVTLAKGQNVLVFKVINEKNNWQGCARFMKDGAGVKNIKVSLTPQ
jgi:RNase P/RNase MRP subunit p29